MKVCFGGSSLVRACWRAGQGKSRGRGRKIVNIVLCSVPCGDNVGIMLKIQQSPLPQSLLSYVAFRVAFRETFDSLSLHTRCLSRPSTPYGYLCEVPFLQEVAPAVQLDLLASTWHKHLSREVFCADLVDESVIYSVCEMTARFVEQSPELVVKMLRGGPLDLAVPLDAYLARELRLLYLELPNDGDFLLISQFLDLDPDEAFDQKLQIGVDPGRMTPMFDVLGRWHASPEMTRRLKGLLTEAETARVASILRVPCLTDKLT
jgi:hypothetical protein